MATEHELEDFLARLRDPLGTIPLQTFIKAWFNQSVIEFNSANQKELLEELKELGRKACRSTFYTPVESSRPNEAGNKMEVVVIDAANKLNLAITRPSGSGYPDLKLDYFGQITYIEVKTYAKGNESQTFRSFYLSPQKQSNLTKEESRVGLSPGKPSKIDSDGHHLVLAFAIENIEAGKYKAVMFHLVDCYGLPCNLKYEANTSNAVLYSSERQIYEETIDPDS